MKVPRGRTVIKLAAIAGLSIVAGIEAYQGGSTALLQTIIAAIAGLAGYEAYQNGSA